MAEMMKAAVVREFGAPLRVEEALIPTPGPGQILVKVAACGVCHTDPHAASCDWPVKPRLPFIPGHEGVGHVAALGEGVRDIKEGDRVGVSWLYRRPHASGRHPGAHRDRFSEIEKRHRQRRCWGGPAPLAESST